MLDFKQLKIRCATCSKVGVVPNEREISECKKCLIYKIFNTPCTYCGKIGGVVPFVYGTAKGTKKGYACPKCLAKFT